MKTRILTLLLALAVSPANAACYADYKAKRDDPLRLQYGVAQLPDAACGSVSDAAAALAPRLAQNGWTLLNILSIFGPEGLDQRKESAGANYLRY
ncbi:hypothetical protein [Phaeovulum sp.]|uniref:hypothetical protein n=1 Tax=Phaeovulum sp. TaxID=2934796 RepID=UPI003566324A